MARFRSARSSEEERELFKKSTLPAQDTPRSGQLRFLTNGGEPGK